MNQFLSTFTSKVFLYVSDIIQIKECTTTGLCYYALPSSASRTRSPDFLPSIRELHQRHQLLILINTLFVLNFAIFARQYFAKENDKRSLHFAKALSTSFYFQKKKVWTETFLIKLEQWSLGTYCPRVRNVPKHPGLQRDLPVEVSLSH